MPFADDIPLVAFPRYFPLQDRMEFAFWNCGLIGCILGLLLGNLYYGKLMTTRRRIKSAFLFGFLPCGVTGAVLSFFYNYSYRGENLAQQTPMKVKNYFDRKYGLYDGTDYVFASRRSIMSKAEYKQREAELMKKMEGKDAVARA